MWFTDEAHFMLSGHVNSRSNIYWGSTPLTEVIEKTNSFAEMYSMGCYVRARPDRPFLVRGRKWPNKDYRFWRLHWSFGQVLDSTWPETGTKRSLMATARWGNAPLFKCDPLMDRNMLLWQSNYQKMWQWLGSPFPRSEPPWLSFVRFSEGQSLWE